MKKYFINSHKSLIWVCLCLILFAAPDSQMEYICRNMQTSQGKCVLDQDNSGWEWRISKLGQKINDDRARVNTASLGDKHWSEYSPQTQKHHIRSMIQHQEHSLYLNIISDNAECLMWRGCGGCQLPNSITNYQQHFTIIRGNNPNPNTANWWRGSFGAGKIIC